MSESKVASWAQIGLTKKEGGDARNSLVGASLLRMLDRDRQRFQLHALLREELRNLAPRREFGSMALNRVDVSLDQSVFTTIYCVLEHRNIQYAGMTQDALRTKWKFVVEFEDEETNEISGTIGQADTREECEGLLKFEMQYHNSHGRFVLHAEAAEVCAKCEGEGQIAAMNGGLVICDGCGGRLGPISNLTTLRQNGTEFLLIRRGDFSDPLSPRRAA